MSLKARWLASMLGVVFVGMAIITLASSRISFYGASRGAYEWLDGIYRNAIGSFHRQLFERLDAQARLLARVPAVQEAISTRHLLELQSQLEVLGGLQEEDFWAVVGEDGAVIATSHPSCILTGVRGRPDSTVKPVRRVLMCGRVPVFAVTAPVMAGERFEGWLVLGAPANEAYADAYYSAGGAEVVLIDRQGTLVSTFLDSKGQRLTPDLGAVPAERLWAEAGHFGKYRVGVPGYRGYLAGSQPLAVGESVVSSYLYVVPLLASQPEVPVRAVLLVPSETLDIGAFYSTLTMIAFSCLLLLPFLGFIVWRLVNSFMKPIAMLGEMTARVAEGDLECELPVKRKDELGQLSHDFNVMVEKLRETQLQLSHSEKMAAIGQLAAGVGHEINNPLSYVGANITFARETLAELSGTAESAPAQPLPLEVTARLQEVSQALEEAQDGAERVGRIVKELRAFARSDHQEEKQALSIRPVIETALKIVSNTLRHRARVTCDFQQTAAVLANEARLVQVFINLLVNAAQAMPEGHAHENEVRITTSMGTNRSGTVGFVVIEVSDTGTGMPPEVLQRIFEPFFTTRPVGQGTGLGLSTSRNIIEGYGGSLTARSTPGKGSTFRISLPALMPDVMASKPTAMASGAPEVPRRVFVADSQGGSSGTQGGL
ncbi:sensor histidine kinase [Hyalangium gracile]|uniref:sensor histidine kinase n=1 Tax=Hyalangium gracile TaxID=394092 RepID=UPI001CCD641D|nr:ATP-binding protein [Hyalangium gracile]